MATHVFNVFPAGDRWEVTEHRRDHVLQAFDHRRDAIEWGLQQARRVPQGQLRLYNRDHTLAEEFTFEEPSASYEFG